MRDLMIDVETLGTAPGSVILTIGAVEFDAVRGVIGRDFYTSINIPDSEAVGLRIDPDTLKWWLEQSKEARDAAFAQADSLRLAISKFSAFVGRTSPSLFWAKPPSFDIVLLEDVYRRLNMVVPWKYNATRDLRTVIELTGAVQPDVGTAHNALDDAKSQALAVIDGYSKMKKD